jgi:hypothetical protein
MALDVSTAGQAFLSVFLLPDKNEPEKNVQTPDLAGLFCYDSYVLFDRPMNLNSA